jgi:ribose transport system substrate-binding protein
MWQKRFLFTVGLLVCGLTIALLFPLSVNLPLFQFRQQKQYHKTIVVVAEDLRNGGILGVVMGIQEAAKAIGWATKFFDICGSLQEVSTPVLTQALNLQPDGLILVGVDARANLSYLKAFERKSIPMVGWHLAPYPGPVPDTPVLVNVTTDSREVALAAAALVKPEEGQTAGIVVFTDNRYQIALEKSTQMTEFLKECDRCTVLAVKDIPLDEAALLTPKVVRGLRDLYGDRWTHSLAINDLYFDHAIRELAATNLPPPKNISAGDGSPSSLLRMKYQSFQYASVVEPLLMQGWQLIDELNRIFAGSKPSGYINPPYVVTQQNVKAVLNERGFFEPDNHYREVYLQSWQGDGDG